MFIRIGNDFINEDKITSFQLDGEAVHVKVEGEQLQTYRGAEAEALRVFLTTAQRVSSLDEPRLPYLFPLALTPATV